MFRYFLRLVIFTLMPLTASIAAPLDGNKLLLLKDRQGNETEIGRIEFQLLNETESEYQIHLNHHQFQDYFLSMKEMKCLEGPELWCFIPYPYQQPRIVTEQNLAWLEHDLLFMFKKLDSFGANFWNGIYYKMQIEDGVIRGTANSLDLNMLASPPDDLSVPPIGEYDIDEADLEKRWLPVIEIR